VGGGGGQRTGAVACARRGRALISSCTYPSRNMHKLEFVIAQELSEITSHRQQPKPSPEGLKALTAGTPAAIVDHTLLNAAALPTEVVALTEAAIKFGCATVCVNSSYIPLVRDTLRAAGVGADAHPRPIAVVGFPLGAGTSKSKAFEARQAIDDGAAEIDMVMNGAL
jgi:hypothetical protein